MSFEDMYYLNEKRKNRKEHQSLKMILGLNDYEANLVEQGRYNPCNFGNDKEELEEDYHYEDDIY